MFVILFLGRVCRSWYDSSGSSKLRTHLKLMIKAKSSNTRAGFEKLKDFLEGFEEDDLKHLHHLSFVNFNNHLTKTFALLNHNEFELETLEILTSQMGNLSLWKEFTAKHTKKLRQFTANGFRFPHKALVEFVHVSTLTKLVLHDSGPIRSLDWSKFESLTHLDIYYASRDIATAGAELDLVKLKLPKLTFLQLANITISERGNLTLIIYGKLFGVTDKEPN